MISAVKQDLTMLVGRKQELDELNDAYQSKQAEFIAVYGRRRVGKTFLIEQAFSEKTKYFLHVTGIQHAPMKDQLAEFAHAVSETFYPGINIQAATSWLDAFRALTTAINAISKRQKIVIFLDELPWLCSKRSRLLQALDYYWNHTWSKDKRITLIICGSSASWIINKIIRNRGGLHNRVTQQILLKPFSLDEVSTFCTSKHFNFTQQQLIELTLFCGGIPFYLNALKKGHSIPQEIDRCCFTKGGLLFDEFDQLFESLFDDADVYKALVRAIAQKRQGATLSEIEQSTDLISNGGTLSKKLKNLEDAAFIKSFLPLHNKRQGNYYRVIDEHCLFYLQWIEPAKKRLTLEDKQNHYWSSKINTPAFYNWRGYAFEMLCYKHIGQIRRALNIPPGCAIGAWRYTPKNKQEKGVQIDLVFERQDGVTTLVEIKMTDDKFVIDKSYYENLKRKIDTYKQQTRTKNQITIAIVSANGLKENNYSEMILSRFIDARSLFE